MRWFTTHTTDATEPEVDVPKPPVVTKCSADMATDATLPSEALSHFEQPFDSLPPSSRIGDPKLKQRENEPIRPWELWKYGAFAAMKATTIAADVVSHQLWGPRRKSWGLQMTLLSSMMRGLSRYSYLTDIETMRALMSISGLCPVPSDALVTPVTFHVRRRNLRGILTEYDVAETGKRELSGEWVIGKKTWKRLQKEWRAIRQGGIASGKRQERIILYLHGGAYYMSSSAGQRLITMNLSKHLDARLFALDYRLAPETRFPGPLHDAVSCYFRLIYDMHVPPENIIVAGDSAGGGLTLALLMYLRDNDYPLPSGTILISPWVDLTLSCESWDSNADYDIVPMPQPGDHLNPILCYLGDNLEKYLTHPYASPLFGSFKGLPPMLIQAGDSEVLRDEITLLAHKASLAGVEVRHELYVDMVHVFQNIPFLEASEYAFQSCADFVYQFLPRCQAGAPQHFGTSAEKNLENEIDIDDARVVRGDGTDTGRGRETIAYDKLDRMSSYRRVRSTSSESSTPTLTDPSWENMYANVSSDDEGDFEDAVGVHPPPLLDSQRPNISRAPSFSRLRATFTAISDAASASASNSIHIPVAHSYSAPPLIPHTQTRRKRHVTSPSIKLMPEAPPRPSIRRALSSHPDITSMCKMWSESGPANQTRTFKSGSVAKPTSFS